MADTIVHDLCDSAQVETPQEPPKSKYTFERTPRGFTIHREGDLSLEVYYENEQLVVVDQYIRGFGLLNISQLVEYIAASFARRVLPKAKARVQKDAAQMITRSLAKRITEQWRGLISEFADERMFALSRKMWASNHTDCHIVNIPEIYTDEYKHLYNDLMKYNGCRLIARFHESNFDMGNEKDRILYLNAMCEWRTTMVAHPNKAMNKTLDHIPSAVSSQDVWPIMQLELSKPITTRLKLIFVAGAFSTYNFQLHERTVLNATDKQIKEASAIVGYPLHGKMRTVAIRDVARMILDFPEPYGGDLVGLARRSRDWHRQDFRRQQQLSTGLEPDFALPAPPIDTGMLEGYGIRWLATVGDCYTEGEEMGHCVGSYASYAARGLCYLFHVDYNGEQATIEVSPSGEINQAYGHHNTKNKACEYGSYRLAELWKADAQARQQKGGA